MSSKDTPANLQSRKIKKLQTVLGILALVVGTIAVIGFLFYGNRADSNPTNILVLMFGFMGMLSGLIMTLIGIQESRKIKTDENPIKIHEQDHQCPSCKKEYDCYLRNEYDECPLAYYESCLDCKLKRVVNDPYIRTGYHPEKKMISVADKTSTREART